MTRQVGLAGWTLLALVGVVLSGMSAAWAADAKTPPKTDPKTQAKAPAADPKAPAKAPAAEPKKPAPVAANAEFVMPKTKEGKDDWKKAVEILNKQLEDAKAGVETAKQELEEARNVLKAAEAGQQATINRLRRDGDKQSNMEALEKAVKDAEEALTAARVPVLAKLQTQEEYKKAVADRDEFRMQVKEQREAEKPDEAAIKAAQEKLAVADAKVSKIEDEALAGDEKAKEAKAKLEAAQQALTAARNKGEPRVGNHPEVQAARKAVEEAKDKVADAQKVVNAATNRVPMAHQRLEWAKKKEWDNLSTEDKKKRLEAERKAREANKGAAAGK